jgi:3-deoxy-D-manno-octulosonate 8-phosphate phosphatase (KDO 8-P phosphatase)
MLDQFKHITHFVFDVDGVLTDGNLLILPDGLMARRMNIKDGYALQLAIKKGYRITIISGGNSPEVKDRLNKLGITEVYMQVTDKLSLLQSLMTKHQSNANCFLFMGDDIPDLKCMQIVGLPACPSDAVNEIKECATYISALKGGEGCVRDVIEKVLKLRGDWNDDFKIRAQ